MCLRWLFLLSTLLVSPVVHADERRVAVVIGVGDYRAVPGVGSRGRRFGASARGADVVLFYYAGHAVESGGSNWLLPISADIRAGRDLRFEATDLDGVLEQFEGVARLAIVVLDACRDNPFRSRLADGSRGIDASRGLIRVQAPVGTLVVFSTAPGTVAADGTGPNSPFAAALLKRIETPGLEIRQMLAEMRRDVRQATRGKQVPWEQSAMEGTLYLKPAPAAPAPPANVPAAAPVASARPGLEAESLFWDSVRNSANPSDLRAYLSQYPGGLFVELAKTHLAALGDGAAKPPATSNGPSLAARLIERMSPLPMAERESVAPLYVQARGFKAMAISPDRSGTYRSSTLSTAALAEEKTLEGCQATYGSPCFLLAKDDQILPPEQTGERARRDMPRASYAGLYDPAMIPKVNDAVLSSPVVTGYAAAREPKAMAFHAWGRMFAASGAASDTAAQQAALADCNNDPDRKGQDGPCFLSPCVPGSCCRSA